MELGHFGIPFNEISGDPRYVEISANGNLEESTTLSIFKDRVKLITAKLHLTILECCFLV
jgi:hypothetical protein